MSLGEAQMGPTFGVIDGLGSGAGLSFSISAVNAAGEGEPATITAAPVSQ
jgi:hypothetical protein